MGLMAFPPPMMGADGLNLQVGLLILTMYYDFPLAVYYPTWLSDSCIVTQERTTPRAFFPFGVFITNSNVSISCKGIAFTTTVRPCAASQETCSSVWCFSTVILRKIHRE